MDRKFHAKEFAMLLVVAVLLSSFTLPAFANHMGGHVKPKPTQLTLDLFAECENMMQCNAQLFSGQEITFSGLLTDDRGAGVAGGDVNIYLFTATDLKSLASAVTNQDGTFEVNWVATFFDKKPVGETFKQQITEGFTVFAQFEGDGKYIESRSGKLIFTVSTKSMFTFVATDKLVYKQDAAALITVNFLDGELKEDGLTLNDFVDPDTIRASYDNIPVELNKKKTGSYVFMTPPLNLGHHQLMINAEKEGHNNRVGFVTVHVSETGR
jgi:hypothetical protein